MPGSPLDVGVVALSALLALVNLLWLLLWVVAWRALGDARYVLRAEPPPAAGVGPGPRVSVIIPARNEAGSIGKAVRSVMAQDWPELELIVIDDNSTDGTGEEATEAAGDSERFKLLTGTPLPEGWMGKCWALWQAQRQATGEVLLFVDADVKLAPETVRCTVRALEERGLDLLSLWGDWLVGSFWERVAQPVVGGFVRGAHPLDRVNDPEQPEVFANGQFIMMPRASYDAFGGHEAVRGEVLEDVRLAQAVRDAGLKGGLFLAPELFAVRLYTSLRDLWFGSVKNFYHGMNQRPGVALAAAAFISTTTLLPWATLATGAALSSPWLVGLSLGCVVQMFIFRYIQDRLFHMNPWYGVTHPLGTAILVGIILHSAWRGVRGAKTSWKGRPV